MDGVWKDRTLAAIAEELEAAVCDAPLRWEQHGVADEVLPMKKARTDGAAEHTVASSTAQPSTGTVQELPDTPDDVCRLRRLGSEMFEATLWSGAVWTGDAVLLKTLPQGEAKLATLTVRGACGRI